MLLDAYGRTAYNLRISVTSKCNLDCIFCHGEGNDVIGDSLTPNGIEEVVKVVTKYGVSRVKITGGEPLIRRDIVEIVNRIASVVGIQEVSMVTNGSLLEPLAEPLKRAGLNRVNINLPSLDRDKYHKVTKGKLESTLRGVRSAVKNGLTPVKINMVLLRGINEDELDDYIKFAREVGAHLQVIELEPIRIKSEFYDEMYIEPDTVERLLETRALRSWVRESMQKRKVYDLGKLNVEVVHPIDNTEFCAFCNRIRLTSDGAFKPCLMRNSNKVYISDALAKEDLPKILKAYLRSMMNREPYFKPC
ncbi:MAG: GTP 3',8-cyclase MoaA [Candidatus Methylarchaceae archaeon HK01M]|nr:GTP 3',8-cyclase MoaA [Candidatus Methylarchaceae archaeon HK01M]